MHRALCPSTLIERRREGKDVEEKSVQFHMVKLQAYNEKKCTYIIFVLIYHIICII